MPRVHKTAVPKGKVLTWEEWYHPLRDDPTKIGAVSVPEYFDSNPCGCRRSRKDPELEIYRAKGDPVFRCNMIGCGVEIP